LADNTKSELNYPLEKYDSIELLDERFEILFHILYDLFENPEYEQLRKKLTEEGYALNKPHFHIVDYDKVNPLIKDILLKNFNKYSGLSKENIEFILEGQLQNLKPLENNIKDIYRAYFVYKINKSVL